MYGDPPGLTILNLAMTRPKNHWLNNNFFPLLLSVSDNTFSKFQICQSIREAAIKITKIMKPRENVEFEEPEGPLVTAEKHLFSNVSRANDRTDHFGIVPGPTLEAH